MRSWFAVLLAAALWAGCASTPQPPPPPPQPPQPPPLRPLSPEAAAFFSRAETPGQGGAIVVNLDALEALGLLAKGQALRQLAGMVTTILPQLAAVEDEGPNSALLARAAVATSVLRHWAQWPSAQRVGALLLDARALNAPGDQALNDVVLALAVEEGSPDNAKLLVGLAALGRSVTEELSREDAEVRMALRGSDLCVEGRELPSPVCLRPRRGLLLLGTQAALAQVDAAPVAAAPAPAATAGETASLPVAPSVPLLLGVHMNLGREGQASLRVTGRDAVQLVARLEGGTPRGVAGLEGVVKKALDAWDAHEEKKRARIGAALGEVRQTLAQDATAPAELKEAARTLTVEQVVDEDGHWAQLRKSVQGVATEGAFTVSLTLPEGMVKDVAEQVNSGGAMAVSTVGILAAIAIPNFVKFQSRAKQSEVKANLKSAFIAQRMYEAEKDRWGKSFKEIGFAPEPGRRYTYCLGAECLPCDKEGCGLAPDPSPCKGITKVGRKTAEGFTICAYGNVDNDPELDVWVIDQTGEPQQLNSDLP
jgi:type IV pilus assembly protein PilA